MGAAERDDGRCVLCESLPKKESGLKWDYGLQLKMGQGAYPRGWVCDRCQHLVADIQTIGLRRLIRYLVPRIEERNGLRPWSAADRSYIVRYLGELFPTNSFPMTTDSHQYCKT
jgi:hypothetical protein